MKLRFIGCGADLSIVEAPSFDERVSSISEQ
jgi:hypothetical protein